MSIKAMARVWEYTGISITDKLVLLAYADHADHDGGSIFPAVQSVAEKTGATRRTVQRSTKRLVKMGLLILEGSSKYGTNQLRMNMEWGGRNSDAPIKDGGRNSDAGGGVNGDTKGRNSDARTVLNHHSNPEAAPFNVFVLWCEVMGYEPSRVTPTKKATECKYGKELLDVDWTLQEIKGCLEELKAQDFWQGKPLSLVHVAKEINEWKHRQTTARTMTI